MMPILEQAAACLRREPQAPAFVPMPKPMFSVSLKARVLILVTTVLLLGIWAIAARVSTVLGSQLQAILAGQLQANASYVATDIEGKLQLRLDILKAVAGSMTVEMLADPPMLQQYLENHLVSNALFPNGIFVANSQGINLADVPKRGGRTGGFIGDRSFFQEVMGGRHQAVSAPLMERFSEGTVVSVAVPVRNTAGEPIGVLVSSADPSDPNLFGNLDQPRELMQGDLMLVSPKDNLIVSGSDKSRILQALPARGVNPVLDRRILDGFEGAATYVTSQGREVLSVSRNLKETGWILIAAIPSEEIYAPITAIQRQIYGAALLLSIALALILYVSLSRQLAPLGKVATSMRRMREGQHGVMPMQVERDDEVGQLISSFNGLFRQRTALEDELRRQQEDLEEQVRDRTADLRMAQAIGHMGNWRMDVSSGKMTWSDEIYRIYGYLPGDFEPTFKHFMTTVHPDDVEQVKRSVTAALAGGRYDVEHRIVMPGGQVRWVHAEALVATVYNANDRPSFMAGIVQDITARRLTQVALQETEHELRTMLDVFPGFIVRASEDYRYEYVNHGFAALFGKTPDEIVGLHPRDLLGEDRFQDLRMRRELTIANGRPTSFERSISTANGTGQIDLLFTNFSVLSPYPSSRRRFYQISIDISERKRAERALAAREAELSAILHAYPGMLARVDNALRYTYVNERFAQLIGRPREQIVGRCMREILGPEREAIVLALLPGLHAGQVVQQERVHHVPGQGDVVLELNFVGGPDAECPGASMHYVFGHDVTEIRRHQQRLGSIIDGTNAGTWEWNVQTGETRFNERWAEIAGYALEDLQPFTIQSWTRLTHEDDLPRTRELLRRHFTGALSTLEQECRVRHKSGAWIWVSDHGRIASRTSAGEPLWVMGTRQDITARKLAEAQLIAARDEAQIADRAKTSFLSSISHELRTPLNAVLGYAQLLCMDESAGPGTLENAIEIEKAGRHLLVLVNDILDLARIESGKVEMSIEDVPLADVIVNCQRLIQPKLFARGIALELPTMAVALRADRVRLGQVLLNLLANAVKYNQDGGRIVLRGDEMPGRRYRISITDSGCGIATDRVNGLFQPFNRLGAERGRIEGTGTGLVIAKALVELMSGSIGVESTVGRGSTFWIELPLASDGALADVTDTEPTSSRCGAILVAEDHEPNRKVLRRQIEKLGYRVDFAFDGSEALHKWRTGHYDLILTDCNMPVMDGYELARAVRAVETVDRIPILAFTANGMGDAAAKCAAAGMDDFLVKPVLLDALRRALAKWLEGPTGGVSMGAGATASWDGAPPVDADPMEALAAILGDDEPVQARLVLGSFVDSARVCIDEMKAGIAQQDACTFARAVHKLKSSARMIGATTLADLCQRIEEACKRQSWAELATDIAVLQSALRETEARIQSLPSIAASQFPTIDLADLTFMLVDDDPFILDYVSRLLESCGARDIRRATEGLAALRELGEFPDTIDVVVCDLNMPGMDGVEFLRHLAESRFKGSVIVVSGSADLLATIYELARAHGLHVLGTLAKPFTPEKFLGLLHQHRLSGASDSAQKMASRQEISPLDIAAALANGEIFPFFQPKVDALTLKPVGAEALARWLRPDGRMVSPGDFIPVIEAHGLTDSLFKTILDGTLACAGQFGEMGFSNLKFAVNMAASSLGTLDLPEHIGVATRKYGMTQDKLILEITESGIMGDTRIGLDVLSRLRIKGVGLSIDDFGTGYSTISQLLRLPFTELKIDRSFVANAAQNNSARIILESSVEMARRLHLSTVAEGVETESDLEMIRALGCDVLQGFLIAKPMPLNELIVWMNAHR